MPFLGYVFYDCATNIVVNGKGCREDLLCSAFITRNRTLDTYGLTEYCEPLFQVNLGSSFCQDEMRSMELS